MFKKNDPKSLEAARKGGKTGKKHFASITKEEHRKISSKGGRAKK